MTAAADIMHYAQNRRLVYCNLLIQKYYFKLIKLSPRRVRARRDALGMAFAQVHPQTYPPRLWITEKPIVLQ
ncbi:MAG TPA: hypothetical protein VFG55_05460 [Rhodanobacteraceae bacterium]|nr:hypothetical protein [Rhodanobacteraceae bacterium]